MTRDGPNDRRGIDRLLKVMAALRDQDGGCPWDREQTFETIAPYTIEEAYEVAEAIRRGDRAALQDELGDLLLQVVFHAQMAREKGDFDFDSIAHGIAEKMIRRHPHVFGGATGASPTAQTQAWEAHKAAEREAEAAADGRRRPGALDGVALALPALLRAEKLQKRAARVGFDWPGVEPVFAQVFEEMAELREAVGSEAAETAVPEELGDLLFACVNLARHLGADAEAALRGANAKFAARFQHIEAALAATGRRAGEADLVELNRLWEEAKRIERRTHAASG